MKVSRFALAFLFAATSALATPPAASPSGNEFQSWGEAPTDAIGMLPLSHEYPLASAYPHVICPSVSIGQPSGVFSVPPVNNQTDRVACTPNGPVNEWFLYLPGKVGSNGQEVNAPNVVFHRASLECPTLNSNPAPPLFTLAGQEWMAPDPNGIGTITDPLGFSVPAGTQCFVRYSSAVAAPPASGAATALAGGSLAASTAYYYRLTCAVPAPGGQVAESGPAAEFSGTTSASSLSLNVTWTPTTSPLGCPATRIYRGTATGAETYLSTVTGPGLNWVDNGTAAPVAGITPPAANVYAYNDFNVPPNSTNGLVCGGTPGDLVEGTGALDEATGQSCYAVSPAMILGDDRTVQGVALLGDSIMAGSGIQSYSGVIGSSPTHANWAWLGAAAAGIPAANLSIPSSRMTFLTNNNNNGGNQRIRQLDFVRDVDNEQCTNDIFSGATWQSCALSQIQIAQGAVARGKRYHTFTLFPRGNSTDNITTQANFTPATTDGARQNYNSWVRNGMQVNGSGFPVLSGGTSTPFISDYFDLAAALPEVNASGVPTPNGGYWPTYSTPIFTGTFTGTPTTTSLTVTSAAFIKDAYAGNVVIITSGAAVGQTCTVWNNTTTTLTCSAPNTNPLTTAPASGDAFQIVNTASWDGTHPTLYESSVIAPAYAAYLGVTHTFRLPVKSY